MIKKNNNIISAFILLVYSFAIRLLTSTYSIMFNKDTIVGDGGCYVAIGREILKGKVLYKDIFDHKMPYLYFINGLASFVNYNTGLFLMEVTILFVTLFFIYKILLLVFENEKFKGDIILSKKISFIIALIGSFIMGIVLSNYTITGGYFNTEPLVMSFVVPTIYVMGKYYYGKVSITEISKTMFIIGILAGMAFMVNLKSIVLFVPLVVPLTYDFIKQKQWIELFKTFCFGISGVILVTLPYVIYMFITNSIKDTIFAVWDTNLAYARDNMIYMSNTNGISNKMTSKDGIIATVVDFVMKYPYIMLLVGLSIIILFALNFNKKFKTILCLQIIIICVTIFSVGRPHTYYLYSLLPYIIVIYVFIVKFFLNFYLVYFSKKSLRIFCLFAIVLSLVGLVGVSLCQNFKRVKEDALAHQYNAKCLREVVSRYDTNFNKLNVFALGLHPEVYLWLDVGIKYKYFVRPFITYDSYRVAIDEQVNYINRLEPDIFCMKNFDFATEIQKRQILYVLNHFYDLIGETDRFYVFGKKHQ